MQTSEYSLTDASHSPAATAAALPPELPPAERPSLSPNGLITGPWIEYLFSDLCERFKQRVHGSNQTAHPIPNSSQFVFPTICAPEVRSSRTTVASYGEEKSVWRSGSVWEEEPSFGWTFEHKGRTRRRHVGSTYVILHGNSHPG